jgi:hypothetical protein
MSAIRLSLPALAGFSSVKKWPDPRERRKCYRNPLLMHKPKYGLRCEIIYAIGKVEVPKLDQVFKKARALFID